MQCHVTRPTDLTAPGALEQLLAFHRQTFGDAVMVEGGDGGEGAPPAAPAAPAAPPASDPAPAASAPASEPAATWNPDAWDGKVESLPASAQKIIADLRKDAGDERVAKRTLEQIAKAINPEAPEGEKVDPAKLAEDLTAAQKAAQDAVAAQRQAAVELAVWRTAGTHQGDPTALLDSRSFLAKVADLDPTAEDFPSKVDAAIKDAVEKNPKLKTGRAPGASSVDHAGGTGEQVVRTPKSLDHAVGGHYGTA